MGSITRRAELMKKILPFIILVMLAWPAVANDDEIVEFLDFFENMELVEDDNYKELIDDDKGQLDSEEDEEEENA
jgi:hypothetical protein